MNKAILIPCAYWALVSHFFLFLWMVSQAFISYLNHGKPILKPTIWCAGVGRGSCLKMAGKSSVHIQESCFQHLVIQSEVGIKEALGA